MGHGRSQQGHSRFNVRKSLWKRSASSVSKLGETHFHHDRRGALQRAGILHPLPSRPFVHSSACCGRLCSSARQRENEINSVSVCPRGSVFVCGQRLHRQTGAEGSHAACETQEKLGAATVS